MLAVAGIPMSSGESLPKILIVDDDDGNLYALQAMLEGPGVDLVMAGSGEEALRQMLKAEFALILLDVRMPDMDGFQTASLIRSRRRSYHTPIIFMTGHNPDDLNVFKGYEVGAVDYMVKPIMPEVLRSKAAVFVDLYRKNDEIKRQRERLRQAAKASEQRFYDLVQDLDAIVWEADVVNHRFSFVSNQAERIFGYPADSWMQDKNFHFNLIHEADRQRCKAFYAGAIDQAEGREVTYRAVTADGAVVWVRDNVRTVRDEHGRPVCLRGVMVDITSHKRAEEHLARLAHYDSLTGLPNRVLLEERLNTAFTGGVRHSGYGAAVMFLDLDRFKMINDTFGHVVGDSLLQAVSQRLRHCMRSGDMIARLGGDEFIFLIDRISAPEEAAAVAQKILAALSAPVLLGDEEAFVTCSIGISFFPRDGHDAQTLIKNADVAMYAAKDQGKNNYQFYSAEMNAHVTERHSLETALWRALERQEFLLYYQPKINLKTGAVTGLEALLRWNRPGFGLISPDQFVPLLEETGLIIPVGEWAVQTACIQNRLWQEAGLPPISLAVNLSPRQFQLEALPRRIADILSETGVDPNLLELEITESMIMKDAGRSARMLHDMCAIGVALTIDDFGTGHSSLSMLRQFPIGTLKIDKSFIEGIPREEDGTIARAVIVMAKSMGLKVVAEGVENDIQAELLASEGCDEGQGHFISEPLTAVEMARYLQRAGSGRQRMVAGSRSLLPR